VIAQIGAFIWRNVFECTMVAVGIGAAIGAFCIGDRGFGLICLTVALQAGSLILRAEKIRELRK